MDTSTIFTYHLILLRLTEIIPLRQTRWSFFYRLNGGIVRILSFCLLTSFSMQVMQSKSLLEFCETFFLVTTVFKCNMSGLYIQHHHLAIRKLQKLLKILDGFVSGNDEIKVFEECLKIVQYWFIFFVSNLVGIIILFEVIIMKSSEPILPLKLWLPWEWEQGGIGFTCAHIFAVSGMFYTSFLEIMGDTVPQAALSVLGAHLRALSIRLEKIKVPAAHEKHLAYVELVECIRAYQFIMKGFLLVEKLIKVPSGLTFGNAAVAQCSLATYMVLVGVQSDIIGLLFLMFVALTFQCFVLCVYGEILQQESKNFAFAVYACDWTSQNVHFRKTLIHLLMQTQRIFQVKAANLFPLNIETFYEIIKINYSTYAVLNQFK